MRLSLLSIAMILVACGEAPTRNHVVEYGPNQPVNGNYYAAKATHSAKGWSSEVAFYIHNDAPERIVNAAIRAAENWNASSGKSLMRYMGRTNKVRGDSLYSSLDDGLTVLYYETSWAQTTGKNDQILATTIWENSAQNPEEIIKGDIILNAETYVIQDAMEDALEFGRDEQVVDAETVLVHEMGHLLGLNHWDFDEESVMNTYTVIGLGASKRSLGQTDEENIQAIYTH